MASSRIARWLVVALSIVLPFAASAGDRWGGTNYRSSLGYFNTLGGADMYIRYLVALPPGPWNSTDPGDPNVDYMYHTGAARAAGGPEVLIIYNAFPSGGNEVDIASLEVFSWACTVAEPCTKIPPAVGTCTTPCPLSDGVSMTLVAHPEWVHKWISASGSLHDALYINNKIEQVGGQRNYTVRFWNDVTGSWQTIWTHTTTGAADDCDDNLCGTSWASIFEGFPAAAGACGPGETPDAPGDCTMPLLKTIGWDSFKITVDDGLLVPTSTHMAFDTIWSDWRKFYRRFNDYSVEAGALAPPQVRCPRDSRQPAIIPRHIPWGGC